MKEGKEKKTTDKEKKKRRKCAVDLLRAYHLKNYRYKYAICVIHKNDEWNSASQWMRTKEEVICNAEREIEEEPKR